MLLLLELHAHLQLRDLVLAKMVLKRNEGASVPRTRSGALLGATR